MKIKYTAVCIAAIVASLISGCKKKESIITEPTPLNNYTVPTTYNAFTNVDHAESTTIIGMMSELSTEINKGTGVSPAIKPSPLDAMHLKNLLKNMGSQFTSNAAYNTSGFQIESNCIDISQPQIESFIDTLVKVSNSQTLASSGVAGLALSNDAAPRRFLFTSTGVNYAQMLFKNLMCDLVLYQITKRVSDGTLDNITNVAGKNYTALEHSWDVAFGFFSVPDSFPTIKTPVKYWGSYSNQVDAGLGCNAVMMNAFLKGRAAISHKDEATRIAQAAIIVAEMDKMTAGAVVQELNEIQTALDAHDQVKVLSALSECRGFVMSMQNNKNTGRIISDAQISTLLGYFPANQWDISTTNLNNIKALIANVYGFSASQMLTL